MPGVRKGGARGGGAAALRVAWCPARALGDDVLAATHLNYHAGAVLLCDGRPRGSLPLTAEALAAARRAGDLAQQGFVTKQKQLEPPRSASASAST
ncbi:hypothetical protein ABT026_31880 [Streptomyces sp. NPDC002734]|uniref:hypothetical protein n=1 Tax=Streptomyces sp. NPDC002734 TaxID=3154426 RepID=UPI003333931F